MEHTTQAILFTGTGATLIMDLGSLLRRALFATPLPNYAMVGRWLAHMPRGRFRHDAIGAAGKMRGEHVIGWMTHYAIGIVFALLLRVVAGTEWFDRPSFAPALVTGVLTVLAPFVVMQPAMGLGFAASRAPRPAMARLQSLLNHAIFGAGLYLAARIFNVI